MDHDANWDDVVTRLKRCATLSVVQYEASPGADDDKFNVLRLLNKPLPPPPVANFYKSCDGIKLLWQGTLNGHHLQGSLNIIPLLESALRVAREEGGEPLEGILWDSDFPSPTIEELKQMAIFEATAGSSSYLTYFMARDEGRLYLVDGDIIKPIIPGFEATIDLLKLYAGANSLRDHLIFQDWQSRIDGDHTLQALAAL